MKFVGQRVNIFIINTLVKKNPFAVNEGICSTDVTFKSRSYHIDIYLKFRLSLFVQMTRQNFQKRAFKSQSFTNRSAEPYLTAFLSR